MWLWEVPQGECKRVPTSAAASCTRYRQVYTCYGLTATLLTCTGAGVGEGDGNNEDPRRWGREAAQLFAPACTSAAAGTGGTTFHVDAGS
jgi:hypothetical protein